MSQKENFFNLNDASQGLFRQLGEGLSTRIFVGEQAMLSFVVIEPNVQGSIHSHPEEQWGVVLEGEGMRIQGDEEFPVKKGDFWLTPGGVSHGIRAGKNGIKVLDVFAPPREEYKKEGSGFK